MDVTKGLLRSQESAWKYVGQLTAHYHSQNSYIAQLEAYCTNLRTQLADARSATYLPITPPRRSLSDPGPPPSYDSVGCYGAGLDPMMSIASPLMQGMIRRDLGPALSPISHAPETSTASGPGAPVTLPRPVAMKRTHDGADATLPMVGSFFCT